MTPLWIYVRFLGTLGGGLYVRNEGANPPSLRNELIVVSDHPSCS